MTSKREWKKRAKRAERLLTDVASLHADMSDAGMFDDLRGLHPDQVNSVVDAVASFKPRE